MRSERFTGLTLATLLVAAAGMFATQAFADELVWRIKSEHPNQVSVEFYSQDRKHVWPGDGDVYVIKDWDTHTYSLSCNYGETICFGAWIRNDSSTYWGAGYDGAEGCESCCFVCGYGETKTQVLQP